MPGGRPTKLTPETQAGVIDVLRRCNSYETAANSIGIDSDTLRAWRKEHPEFSGMIKNARSEARQRCINGILEIAAKGQWQAYAWLLERLWPDEFGTRLRTRAEMRQAEQDLKLSKAKTEAIESGQMTVEPIEITVRGYKEKKQLDAHKPGD
jgi:transposase-like protein